MEVSPAPAQNWQYRKQNRNSSFCNKSAKILQHVWNISATCSCSLQLYRDQWPVGKDQKVSLLLQVSLTANCPQSSADLSQFAEVMDLTTWKWSTDNTCKLVFFVYSILASPKHVSFLFFLLIFFTRGIYNQPQPSECPHLRFPWRQH